MAAHWLLQRHWVRTQTAKRPSSSRTTDSENGSIHSSCTMHPIASRPYSARQRTFCAAAPTWPPITSHPLCGVSNDQSIKQRAHNGENDTASTITLDSQASFQENSSKIQASNRERKQESRLVEATARENTSARCVGGARQADGSAVRES